MKVLIVENDSEFAAHMERNLAGCESVVVEDADEARAELAKQAFDAVFVDITIADKPGGTFGRAIPVIALAAKNDELIIGMTGDAPSLEPMKKQCDAAVFKSELLKPDQVMATLIRAQAKRKTMRPYASVVRACSGASSIFKPNFCPA